MWIRPWGFKEGCLIGAGLLVTGWLLQITIGEIDWSLFAYPVNIIVLVLYIAGIVAMHCLRKRVYFFLSATQSAPVSATALPPMEDVFPSSRYFLPMSVFLTAATV